MLMSNRAANYRFCAALGESCSQPQACSEKKGDAPVPVPPGMAGFEASVRRMSRIMPMLTVLTGSQRTHSVPRFSLVACALLTVLALGLTGCGATTTAVQEGGSTRTSTAAPTATTAPAPTATLAAVTCGSQYGSAYQATLPDATYTQTTIFSAIQLPPQTRSYDNDAAGGLRGRFFCSSGTSASVLSFMTQQLAQQGWQPVATASDCGQADIRDYGSPQCWRNGKYHLFLGVNSNTDWVVA